MFILRVNVIRVDGANRSPFHADYSSGVNTISIITRRERYRREPVPSFKKRYQLREQWPRSGTMRQVYLKPGVRVWQASMSYVSKGVTETRLLYLSAL